MRRKASPESDAVAMDQTRYSLTPDEVGAVARFIEVCELVEQMGPEEAASWRSRLLAWRAFLELGESAEPNG